MMNIISLIPTLAKVRMVNPQIQKYFFHFRAFRHYNHLQGVSSGTLSIICALAAVILGTAILTAFLLLRKW